MKNLGCFYHLTWATKYRQKMFSDIEFRESMMELIEGSFAYIGKTFEILVVDIDHVHILLECSPNKPISQTVNRIKSLSARRWNRLYNTPFSPVWQKGYSVSTVSFSRYEDLEKYLDHHNLKRKANG